MMLDGILNFKGVYLINIMKISNEIIKYFYYKINEFKYN